MDLRWSQKGNRNWCDIFVSRIRERTYLLEQQVEEGSVDGPFNFIENLTNRIQEEFDETIEEDGEKNIL